MNLKGIAILLITVSSVVDIVLSQSCLGKKGLGKWVRAREGAVPTGAISGGYEKDNKMQYICRSAGTCGNVMESTPCYYTYNKEYSSDDSYDVLTDVAGVWVPVVPPNLPCNILKTGGAANAFLYSCRAFYKKQLIIGKFQNNVCIIGYKGALYNYKRYYEIFTAVPEHLRIARGKNISLKADGKYFAFQLKADNESVVTFGNGDEMLYSIAIGALDNSVVSIGPANSIYDKFKISSDILSSSQFKSFWIRWSNKKLDFGKEGDLIELVSYKAKGADKIDSIHISSSFGESEWKIASLTYK